MHPDFTVCLKGMLKCLKRIPQQRNSEECYWSRLSYSCKSMLIGGQVGTISHEDYNFFYCTIKRSYKTSIGSISLASVFLHAVLGIISRRCLAATRGVFHFSIQQPKALTVNISSWQSSSGAMGDLWTYSITSVSWCWEVNSKSKIIQCTKGISCKCSW